ncbi:hypothetical protein FACS189435_0220 [Bacteroidia bacterium]|nr:hypothetical protein FACS189435_0220 [Bacteroidia bacterium]
MLTVIFNILDKIKNSFQPTCAENWGYLNISEAYSNEDKSSFNELNNIFTTNGIQSALTYFIGANSCSTNDFISDLQNNDTWRININKEVLIRKEQEGGFHLNFFYSQEEFTKWRSKANPFEEAHPFNTYSPIKIVVKDIKYFFGGSNILVCNQNNFDSTFAEPNTKFPTSKDILDVVHVVAEKPFCIYLEKHLITFGEPEKLIPNNFLKNSAKILLCCLVNEIQKDDKVILRGVRRLDMVLCGTENIFINLKFNSELMDAVHWVYGEKERRNLRLKLLLERITLDIDLSKPLLVGLPHVIENNLQQAKEHYSYIVYERKDSYPKELKDLLKDLKSLSDLYSNKVRSLLSNLLRDVLAAFILVGITLFSKATEILKLFENKLIQYVFIAFGGYFIVSAIFQMITDFYYIQRSSKEFDYWKNVSREYMSQKDFETYKSKTLNKRARGSIIIYLIIIVCYISIAFACFNFPCIWNKIVN